MELLKPFRHAIGVDENMISLRRPSDRSWAEYWARNLRELLQFLPHFLATFLAENFPDRLRLPDPPAPTSQRYYPDECGRNWSMHELNKVLRECVVARPDGAQLAVMGGVRWESELFRGSMGLRVRTLDKHYGKHRQVKIVIRQRFDIISMYGFLF